MKKYIGTKKVEAEPMNLGEFINKSGRNPYANDGKMHGDDEPGYFVKYADGYESWSPAETFEKAYKVADTFLDRLTIELDELIAKYAKCTIFVDSDKFRSVLKEDYPAFLLWLQRDIMKWYLQALSCRMNIVGNISQDVSIKQMPFGIAIEALNFGLAIRRKGWNGKGLFVVKQVPSHIESGVIPKMQSLPQSAKDLIMNGKGFIDYTSQCLIYNENTGRADSWVASVSDMFAEDWEIVINNGTDNTDD